MKSGVTLLELILALAIGSLLSVALYNSFSLTNRVVQKADELMGYDVRFATSLNLLTRDIQSAFAPRYESFSPEPVSAKKDDKSTPTQEKQPEPKAPVGKDKQSPKKKKSKVPTIPQLFYSSAKDSNTEILTFITSNTFFAPFKGEKSIGQSRSFRVYYRLVKDPENDKAFILTRQESSNLDVKKFDTKTEKAVRPFEVARGIKSLRATFSYPSEFKKIPKLGAEVEYKTRTDWNRDKLGDQEKAALPTIPQFVTLDLELWDDKFEGSEKISATIEIVSFFASVSDVQKKKPQPPKEQKIGSKSLQDLAKKMTASMGNKMPVLKITRVVKRT